MDIQFVQYLDLLPFKQVIALPNAPVPTLDVYGNDFSSVSTVYVNGIESPSVVAVSKSRLWVQVPDSMRGSKISDLAVYSNGVIATERSKIVYSLRGRKSTRGITKLIQYFVKLLVQKKGRDVYDGGVGGGLNAMIGRPIQHNARNRFESVLFGQINSVAAYIRGVQQSNGRVPLDERLLAATIQGIGYSPDTGSASARVLIRSEAGGAGLAGLTTEA